MYKFGLVVLAVVACVQAASVPKESTNDLVDTFKDRMSVYPGDELEVTIEGLEKAMRLPGVSEAVKECLKGQLQKVKDLGDYVDQSLKECAGDRESEVREVLENLQAAFQNAGAVGVEAAGQFQECLKLLPNLIKFNRCVKEVLHFAAGSAVELAATLADTAIELAKLGAETVHCSRPVIEQASKSLGQISLDALKCLGKRE